MKYLFILVLILTFTHDLLAEQIVYKSGLTYKYYNSVSKKQYDKEIYITIETINSHLFIYIEESLVKTAIEMDRKNTDALIKAIEKYNSWNIKATEKAVTLEKEITKIQPIRYYIKSGETWYPIYSYGREFSVTFFSQNKRIHQLYLSFPNMKSHENEFVSHKINTIYLTYTQANAIKKALSKDSVKTFLARHKKQKIIENEFK